MSVFVRKGKPRLPIKNVTVDIAPAVKSAIGGFSGGAAALAYYDKMFISQMDRRVRQSLRVAGMTVS